MMAGKVRKRRQKERVMDLQKRMKLEIEESKAALEKEKRLNFCLQRSVVWNLASYYS